MSTFAQERRNKEERPIADASSRKHGGGQIRSQSGDNRPETIIQRKLQETLNQSPKVQSQLRLQQMLNQSPRVVAQMKLADVLSARQRTPQPQQPIQLQEAVEEEELLGSESETPAVQRAAMPEEEELLQGRFEPVQQKENRTGLPDNLKAGVENLSGLSMDDVRVHYNSAAPATVQALAYTQGTEIHVGPGQEQHLAHEAWHVAQQKQGRVQPTTQMKGTAINDDAALEREADVMGVEALQARADTQTLAPAKTSAQDEQSSPQATQLVSSGVAAAPVAQLVSDETLELWDGEHDQTITLDSGSKAVEEDSVDFNNGDIHVGISEHAANHFANRHTIKEFSFKDENIKRVNSFWETGTDKDGAVSNAKTVLEGLKDDIVTKINEGGGAVVADNNTVGDLTVGYKIGLEVDADSYNDNTGNYDEGTGQMEMFYPEGGDYSYYSSDELKEIRTALQADPYNKVLQLKLDTAQAEISHSPNIYDAAPLRTPSVQNSAAQVIQSRSPLSQGQLSSEPPLQLMTEEAAREILREPFGDDVYTKFTQAMAELGKDDYPPYLIGRIKDLPYYYLPTTKEIWMNFIKRVLKYEGAPLTVDSIQEMLEDEPPASKDVVEGRAKIMEAMVSKADKDASVSVSPYSQAGKIYEEYYAPLYDKILNGKLTFNFAIDNLFKYRQPYLINAFELEEKFGSISQNIEDELKEGRLDAEKRHFGLPSDEKVVETRLRPRYAAINFKGHEFGAAARNDYGMSYMVLKDEVKANTTITIGDSFDSMVGPYPITANGVKALLIGLAKQGIADKNLASEKGYGPGDTYIEAQIHQDIDIRKDVEEIVVSVAEMHAFNLNIDVIDKLIGNLTSGLFIRVTD